MPEELNIPINDTHFLSAVHGKPEESVILQLDRTLVIMVHSFPGSKEEHNELYGDLEVVLNEKGYHTLRFDFQGCGESSGHSQNFTLARASEDFQCVLHWAKENGYRNFVYIAEGLGASLACMNAPKNLSSLILLWPVLDIKKAGEAYFKLLKGQKTLEKEVKSLDLSYCLEAMDAPTLILHGAEDKIIPLSQLDIAKKHFKSGRIEITTFHDGEHGLEKINHRKMMFYHITQFIEKYI